MGIDDFLKLGQVSIETAILVSGPMLVFGIIAGLGISIFQAATQISDAALAFIPKILATVLGLVLFGNFMLNRLMTFTVWTIEHIPDLTR